MLYLWDWFCELAARRQSNGFGLSPLSWESIESWARLTGRDPQPWEVAALGEIEALEFRVKAEEEAKKRPTKGAR